MKVPVAFQLLSALSAHELNQLEMFLSSPAINRRQEMPALLKWWRTHRYTRTDKKAIYEQVFEGQAFRSQEWYLLLSRFTRLVELFMVWQEIRTEEQGLYPFLLGSLRSRQKPLLFQRSMKQAVRLHKKRGQHTAQQLHYAYQLEQLHYDYIASYDRQSRTNLQEMSDRLDEFFIAEKLKQACLEYSRFITNQEKYDIHFLEEIERQIIHRPDLRAVPAVEVYYACYLAVVKGGSRPAFETLRKAMSRHQQGFPKQEMRDLYLLATNYCIRSLNKGEEDFAKEAFSLYEQSLNEGYLLEDGHMPESTFGNIVSLGLKLEQYEWVETFISSQRRFLKPEVRDSISSYNSAKLAYERGDLKVALQLLATVEARQPFLYFGTKTLQLKAFYELGEWDALDSLLESWRVYLQRHPDLGYHRAHYQLLLQFTRRLIQLAPMDHASKAALKKDIEAARSFRERPWFLLKLE